MNIEDFAIHSTKKLDKILEKCCSLVIEKNSDKPGYWGMVGACVLDGSNNAVFGVNHLVDGELRDHAEVVAIKNYIQAFGRAGLKNAIIITTLSPCTTDTDQPNNRNCTEYINKHGIKKVYCGYVDPTQPADGNGETKKFHTMETRNDKLRAICRKMASTFLD